MKSTADRQYSACRGLSVIEMMIVVAIVSIAAGLAIPDTMTALRTVKFRGAVSDFSGLLHAARINAIQNNRYYSTYILAATGTNPQEGYVDMLPEGTTGASGDGGTAVEAGDPIVTIPPEVVQEAATSAPNTSNLKSQLLPSVTPITPTDATVTPITFSPRGLPCLVVSLSGGSVCNGMGGPVAFWTFFEDSITSGWEAVTITPAGRIQEWYYSGSAWVEM